MKQYSLAYWLFHAITFECSTFKKIFIFKILPVYVALKPLVSLFGCLIVRGGRKRGNRQTHRHTYQVLYHLLRMRRGLMKITEATHTCKMSFQSHPCRYICSSYMIYTPLTWSCVLGFAPLSSNTLTVS